jgi:tetratricopeptide (TPR) repeat protein
MEESEFSELVKSCARTHRISIDDKRISQMHSDCEGHPYIAKLHVAELRANPAASIRATLNKDKIQEDLLERTYVRLDEDGRRVFLLLCTFKSVIFRLALKLAIESEGLINRDIDEVLDELAASSLISSSTGADGSFVSVPPIARSFGDRKLNAYDEKLAVDAMARVLRLFGPITHREAMAPSSEKSGNPVFLKNFWKKATETQDCELREKYVDLVKLAANHHPVIWGWLSEYYKQQGNLLAAIDSLRQRIEHGGLEETADALKRLAFIYQVLGNDEEKYRYLEMQAWVRRAEIESVSIDDLQLTAGRVNGYIKEQPSLSFLERRSLVEPMARILENRIAECNADQLSALAHLQRRLGNHDRAQEVAEMGLTLDPENFHCRRFLHLD